MQGNGGRREPNQKATAAVVQGQRDEEVSSVRFTGMGTHIRNINTFGVSDWMFDWKKKRGSEF